MRGKALAYNFAKGTVRITPAYAGKSYVLRGEYCRDGDHPRLCGEKCFLDSVHTAAVGSPPPMRGKEITTSRRFINPGITPAYAGKSQQSDSLYGESEDHPRLCGEKQTNSGQC